MGGTRCPRDEEGEGCLLPTQGRVPQDRAPPRRRHHRGPASPRGAPANALCTSSGPLVSRVASVAHRRGLESNSRLRFTPCPAESQGAGHQPGKGTAGAPGCQCLLSVPRCGRPWAPVAGWRTGRVPPLPEGLSHSRWRQPQSTSLRVGPGRPACPAPKGPSRTSVRR